MDDFLATDFDVVRKLSELGIYEYIIVGSGFGGGILAEELARRRKKVLLIEKGGPTFSTHICNTARPDFTRGKEDSPEGNETIYNKLKAWVQINEDSEAFVGGPLHCLGGRSLVWGLWIPPTDKRTLEAQFPKVVADDLQATWFKQAFSLVTNNSQEENVYPEGHIEASVLADAKVQLTEAIRPYLSDGDTVELGPIATELISRAPYHFPQGAYSTAVPLLNRIYARDEYLTVLMGAEVLSLDIPTPNYLADTTRSVTSMTVRETSTKKLYQISIARAKFILSAGTLNTANIALNSGMQLYQPLVGKGLIDHAVWCARFARQATHASKDPILLQTMINICDTTALLTVTINNNFFLAGSSSVPIHQYLDRHGKTMAPTKGQQAIKDEEFDTIAVLLEFGADLDEKNEVINVGSPNPIIRLRRNQKHDDEESQIKMQELATQIRDTVIVKVLTANANSQPAVTSEAQQTDEKSAPAEATQADEKSPPVKVPPPITPTFPKPPARAPEEMAPRLSLLGSGVFAHEVGTMRMDRPGSIPGVVIPGVVDTNLQVRGFSNFYVCDMSVLPYSPPSNPAITLAALSLRLAEYLEPTPVLKV